MRNTTLRTARAGLAVAALAAGMLIAGCTSQAPIRSDYDKSADFGRFRTFGFLEPADQAKSLGMQMLEAAATREMEARGYKLADNPDLVVNFTGKVEDRMDVQSVPGPYYGPGWGYGGWYGAPYGGWSSTQVTTRHYQVGTLVMDIVDREKRQVVFQAGVEKTVTKEMLEKKEQAINTAVSRFFATYPFVAGQSAPVALPDKK